MREVGRVQLMNILGNQAKGFQRYSKNHKVFCSKSDHNQQCQLLGGEYLDTCQTRAEGGLDSGSDDGEGEKRNDQKMDLAMGWMWGTRGERGVKDDIQEFSSG